MNVGQLRQVLCDAEALYREAGDTKRANLLAKFSNLLDGNEALSVARLAERVTGAWQGPVRADIRGNGRRRRERVHSAK